MGSTLVWRPVIRNDGNCLSSELKFILQKKGDLPRIFDLSDLSYLRGLADAGIKGAQEVIDAIGKHGEIEITEEF